MVDTVHRETDQVERTQSGREFGSLRAALESRKKCLTLGLDKGAAIGAEYHLDISGRMHV